jgi:formylglycine-generating enzyme required for sulfatase activity/serine/threonine protein kinase
MIVFSCPGCHKPLTVKEDHAGKMVKCPSCGKVATAPNQAVVSPAVLAPNRAAPPIPAAGPPLPGAGLRVSLTDQPTAPLPQLSDATSPPGDRTAESDPSLTEFLAPRQADDELGRLGGFRILKVLGHGGMGVVFEGEDPKLDRKVAIKAMLPHLVGNRSSQQRFLREAKAAAALEHDHIVPILQVGEDRGAPFLVMPFLKGEPLDVRLHREKTLPIAEVLRIGRETAEGLAAAHERGLIHRDIKPANLWLEAPHGRVKILDFGLARASSKDAGLTQEGVIIGTPAFMAPEQGRGEKLDGRCDLWSLGVVLYRLCTGLFPFQGADTVATLVAVALNTPAAPATINREVPAGLSDLVMKLLEKDPAKRIASAQHLVAALLALERQLARREATETAPAPVAVAVPVASPAAVDSNPFADLEQPRQGIVDPRAGAPRRAKQNLEARSDEPQLRVLAPGLPPLPPQESENTVAQAQGSPSAKGGRKRRLFAVGIIAAILVATIVVALSRRGGKRSDVGEPHAGDGKDNKSAKAMETPKQQPGDANSVGMKVVRIPAGRFLMGSPNGEKDRSDDEEQHEVEISKPFWLGIHEVTQKQFQSVMGYNPSYFSRNGAGKRGARYPSSSPPAGGKNAAPEDTSDFPVENVSWEEAKEFCEKLTQKEGGGRTYRLPTEAEWEYACRGGAPSYQVFHFGDSLSSRQANFDGGAPYGGATKGPYLKRTCKVGSYEPNRFGLFDMHGNVREWCSDWYARDYYGRSRRTDPPGAPGGDFRVVRGGSWYNVGGCCRSAYRINDGPTSRGNHLGFRVALVP